MTKKAMLATMLIAGAGLAVFNHESATEHALHTHFDKPMAKTIAMLHAVNQQTMLPTDAAESEAFYQSYAAIDPAVLYHADVRIQPLFNRVEVRYEVGGKFPKGTTTTFSYR